MARSRSLRRFELDEAGFEHCFEPQLARRRRHLEKERESKKALVVDRSTASRHLERAAKRLKYAHADDRVLVVPQWNMDKAMEAMRQAGVEGRVSNLCGTRTKRVKISRC